MTGYYLSSPTIDKSVLDVSAVCTVPLEFLKEELVIAFKRRDPERSEIHLAKRIWYKGIHYSTGMVVAHFSEGCLPEFGEIIFTLCIGVFFVFRNIVWMV